jgi:pilus assembly protein FimV
VARVASIEAFRQAGIEYSPALVNLRFSKEIKERGGRRFIELSTDRPLNEPFIDMLVELSWASGRLVREYTFLLDPPDLNRPAPAAAAADYGSRAPPVVEKRPLPRRKWRKRKPAR